MKTAVYARYSTDRQNESSIADQVRVCIEYAQRQEWTVTTKIDDQGISGAALGNRPGVLRLQAAALARRFDVLLVTDLSRLSRSQGDLSKLIDRLVAKGIRVIGVQDGYDSSRRGHKLQAGLSGIIGEAFREMVKDRTYAALESRAKDHKPTGGRAYGYRGNVIESAEAAIVVEVFTKFSEGYGYRAIAAELNARGVASPGSTWKRRTRRAGGWMGSGIRVMLLNERYRGVVHWNTSEWRKDPDTGKRLRTSRPRAEWVSHSDEALRIIPEKLWLKVRSRLALRTDAIAKRVRSGKSRVSAKSTGRGPKFLLSGLLKCQACGSAYVIAGKERYACGGHVDGRNCTNNATMRRPVVEGEVVAGIKKQMRDPAVIAEIAKRVRAEMRKPASKVPDGSARIAQLEKEVGNMADAIAQGVLRASPTLAARMAAAEDELARLRSARPDRSAPAMSVETLIADLPKRAQRAVAELEKTLASGDIPRAREELRSHVGTVSVDADEREIRLWGDKGDFAAVLLRANGTNASNCGSGGRI